MRRIIRTCLTGLSFVLFVTTSISTARAAVIFDNGASWRYVLGTQEASNPTSAWRGPTFNDAVWEAGGTPIGYGEAGVITTLPSSASGNYLTVFLRKTFVVAQPGTVQGLTLNVNVDDGCIAWINGVEIGRFRMNAGEPTYQTVANVAEEPAPAAFSVSAGLQSILVPGTNVVAVLLANANSTSSDLLFDASLVVQQDEPPVVESIIPTPGLTVQELNFVEVVFNEGVTNVNAADLLVNGIAATNVSAYSPRGYIFYFSPPPTGAVVFAWAPAHGITDLSTPANAFQGTSWTNTFDPTVEAVPLVISEFMADNRNGISDEDGANSDWIEIYNPGFVEVSLHGYHLTDVATNLNLWSFPNVILEPNKYLLVWASGKDRRNPAAPLHTNFRLERSGEYLALVRGATNITSEFSPYPGQTQNVSYGRDHSDPGLVGFFTTPTPGAQNSTSGTGFAPAPGFSVESGVFTNASISVALSAPAGTIRYTLNGTEPTSTSTAYTAPINLTANTVIKARVFQAGLWPGPIVAHTYHFLDASVRNFSSKLPLVVINTSGQTIAQNVIGGGQRTRGSLLVFDTYRGLSSLVGKPDFQGVAQFEIFGQTSAGFPKQPLNIEINDEYGNDQAASILGMPAEADWKLRNPYSDKPLMNDFLVQEIFENMGRYGLRRRLVEVFVDRGGGAITYPGDYYGVMCLLEKIEIGDKRVDLKPLTPYQTNEPDISGGYIWKKDKDSAGDLNFNTTGSATLGFSGQGLKIHEPKPRAITTNQLNWLRNHLNQFEASLYATDWLNRTGTNHYSHYIDVDSFVDHHWIVEFTKQIDGYRLSNYMQKDRNGKIKMEPLWDWNLAFGNADYNEGEFTNGWYYTVTSQDQHIWLRRLISGTTAANGTTGDPDFKQKIVDRWSVLRTNVLNGTNLLRRIDELAALLSDAAVRDNAKFPRWGTDIWPNPTFYATPTTYQGIIDAMKRWVNGRYHWIDSQFTQTPVLHHPGGDIAAGYDLVISASAGTIYYTTDGSDPRASGGAVSTYATQYSGPVRLNGNARVVARARNGSNWSGPVAATYVVQKPSLIVSELMYHPADPLPGSTNTDEAFEYIELKNTGSAALNLQGFTLSGGIDFLFPNISVPAGEYVLVVKDLAAFESRYGTGQRIAGVFSGSLDNASDRIVLSGRYGEPILDFTYHDQWYPVTDGAGFSLVPANEQAPATAWNDPAQWLRSGGATGSPGAADSPPGDIPQVVINEILTHTDLPVVDAIELLNLSGIPADVSGWFLTDDFNNPFKFRIPAGTPPIAPGGYLVFTEADFNNPASPTGFALSSAGDEVYLFSAGTNSQLSGYVHGTQLGAQLNGVTFGRLVNSQGEEHFVSQQTNTLTAANSPPRVGPIIISEVMYRPPEVWENGAYWNNTEDEYIELFNSGSEPVALYNSAYPTNSWRISGAVDYTLPLNTTLPAGGYLILANFNPATEPAKLNAFRIRFGVPAQVPVLGPFSGNLSNGDEKIRLELPDNPIDIGANAGQVPYVLVETVGYAARAPWPEAADGLGHALHRVDPASFADDPANWAGGAPTPGAARIIGDPPLIITQPQDQTALSSMPVTLNVQAGGPGPFRYQWRFEGQSIPDGTNSTLVLENVQLANSGAYSVVVLNPTSAITSSNATLTVLQAAVVTQAPEDLQARPGTGVTLQVSAISTHPLTYQWQFNAQTAPNTVPDWQPLPGATNASLTVTNVQPAHDGFYRATITDVIGTVYSAPARLLVLIDPLITIQPDNVILTVGETLRMSTAVTNTATLPIGYRWRRNSANIASNEVWGYEHTLEVPNVGTNESGIYTVVTANRAKIGGLLSRNAFAAVVIPPTNQVIAAGASTAFDVAVYTRPTRVFYQWQFNGQDIPDATNRTLELSNIQAPQLGEYGVLVTLVTNTPVSRLFTASLGFPVPDADNDGIPDAWEQAYGFGANSPGNAGEDPDNDKLTNLQEFIAGTDPTDPASCLKVEEITGGATATLEFAAMSNKTYTVQVADEVKPGSWGKLTNLTAHPTNRTARVVDPQPGARRFYRLVTPRIP